MAGSIWRSAREYGRGMLRRAWILVAPLALDPFDIVEAITDWTWNPPPWTAWSALGLSIYAAGVLTYHAGTKDQITDRDRAGSVIDLALGKLDPFRQAGALTDERLTELYAVITEEVVEPLEADGFRQVALRLNQILWAREPGAGPSHQEAWLNRLLEALAEASAELERSDS